jgi:hypothetical protein
MFKHCTMGDAEERRREFERGYEQRKFHSNVSKARSGGTGFFPTLTGRYRRRIQECVSSKYCSPSSMLFFFCCVSTRLVAAESALSFMRERVGGWSA